METIKSPLEIHLSGIVSRAVTLPEFAIAGKWPGAPGPGRLSRRMGRVFLAAALLLTGLMTITAGCASSSDISTSNSRVSNSPRYTSWEGFIRKQEKLNLAARRRHKEQERLEFKRQEAVRRALRWEKLQQILIAAKLGHKENL